MERLMPDIESYSDLELIKAWDYLESLVLNNIIEQKMDEITFEIGRRSNRLSMGGSKDWD